MFFILMAMSLTVPYNVCFIEDADPIYMVFEVMMDISFIIDIFFTFLSVIKDEKGHMVTSRKKIANSYLSGWFWIDMPSSIPFQLFEVKGNDAH